MTTENLPSVEAMACTIPMPIEHRESYLVIKDRESMAVVAVIELLSPSNIRSGSTGHRVYLQKRAEILASASYLVEIDLLREGERPPIIEKPPVCDYCCIVSRFKNRPRGSLYGWSVRQPLPTIPIPLKPGDDDVMLPLQTVFNAVYDRAGYDLSVDYKASLTPASDKDTAA